MESKGDNIVPSEEHYIHPKEEPVKESPIPKDEDGDQKQMKENKKKETKGKKLRLKKTFWVCFSNVQIGSRVFSHKDENKKKTKKELDDEEFKVREKGFWFSNVEIKDDDEEKVQMLVDKLRKKSCFLVCCSNIEVAL